MQTLKDVLAGKGSSVATIAPGATVLEAIKLMAEKHIGSLVVTHAGRVNGIITERDYARKVILKGKQSKSTLVKEIMSRPVITVNPSRTIDECMALMTDKRVRHLPVLEDGKLVGLVSIGDLVKAIISEQKFLIKELIEYIGGSPEVS